MTKVVHPPTSPSLKIQILTLLMVFLAEATVSPAHAVDSWEPHFIARMMDVTASASWVGSGSVVLFGDSNTEQFRPIEIGGCAIINAGLGGARINDLETYARQISKFTKPKIVHLMGGTNDIPFRSSLGAKLDVTASLSRVIAIFRSGGARVVVWQIPPVSPVFGTGLARDAIAAEVKAAAVSADRFEQSWAESMIGPGGQPTPGSLADDGVHLTLDAQRARAKRIEQIDTEMQAASHMNCSR